MRGTSRWIVLSLILIALFVAPIATAIPLGVEVVYAADETPPEDEISLFDLVDIWIWLVQNGEW